MIGYDLSVFNLMGFREKTKDLGFSFMLSKTPSKLFEWVKLNVTVLSYYFLKVFKIPYK